MDNRTPEKDKELPSLKTKPFRLKDLPILPLDTVLRMMNPTELFNISLCCQHMYSLAKPIAHKWKLDLKIIFIGEECFVNYGYDSPRLDWDSIFKDVEDSFHMENNSVLMEDSNMEPRRSLSQPSLSNDAGQAPPGEIRSTETTPKHGLSNSHSASNVRNIPIIQTWHENEELKGQLYKLSCDIQMYKRKYLEAKEASDARFKDNFDDYVRLKLASEDMEERSRLLVEKEEEMRTKTADFEHQKLTMEQRIRELEQISSTVEGNTTFGSFRGTLDDILKKNDPNFTITGEDERKINDLEMKLAGEQQKVAELEEQIIILRHEIEDQSARLADSENLRIQLEAASGQGILGAAGANTFVIGNARESQNEEQIRYIDELETKLTTVTNESEKVRLALVNYMNKCSKLENDIHTMKKNSTFDTSSLLVAGKTSEELKAQIDKVNGELNTLRQENRDLRIRCDQLTGGDGNLSVSLGQSRLMAGISANDLASQPEQNDTGNTSMRILPRESQLDMSQLQESQLPLMDTTAAQRNKEEFEAAWRMFEAEKNGLLASDDCSFDTSMPPPGVDATQSFLSQKGFRNSPQVPVTKRSLIPQPQQQLAEQIKNDSFSTKNASVMGAGPLLQDVQQILDSSQVLLDGQHDAAANVEKMQEKMTQVREALARLFERLKSSAALFEEILEKMGSSSPLADRIKQMKLAFETSMCDHADVSVFLEAAEKDLANMSLNFSVLEKSIVTQSFVADVSRRFTIAPSAEDVASSSLLHAPYSPIFKNFAGGSLAEIEKLQKEITDLKNELDLARARELRSPLQNTSGRLSDVQIKAAQNFEELEVCQATLKKVESEKAVLAHELADLDTAYHRLTVQLEEVRQSLTTAVNRADDEKLSREKMESALSESEKLVAALKSDADEQCNQIVREMERRVAETENKFQQLVTELKTELKTSLDEEDSLRNFMEEVKAENTRLRHRVREAEQRIEEQADERKNLVEQLVAHEEKLEKLEAFEKEATNYERKMEEKKTEMALTKARLEMEKEAVSGLKAIQKEIAKLTRKNMKAQIVAESSVSIRSVCDEICERIRKEAILQHEYAASLSAVNDKIEQLALEKVEQTKENEPPRSTVASSGPSTATQKTSSSKFLCPTRQLLHESTMAVDSIVQRLKKTHTMSAQELKETVVQLLIDSRQLRDFLHQKLNLFKGIDVSNWKNETVEQLLQRLEQCYQDNLILEEEIRKYKKELKQMRASIPNLGADVRERIKLEIGGIAKDMGAVKALRTKK